jgi:regulatory protein
MKYQKSTLTPMMALEKLKKYCDYQDRCHQEDRNKLLELGVYGSDLEEVITSLIQEGFLNEERYAKSFVRGKFRIKRWGKIKITYELKKKNISSYCIGSGLEEIEDDDYLDAISFNIQKAMDKGITSDFEIIQYTTRKGFEPKLVVEFLKHGKD